VGAILDVRHREMQFVWLIGNRVKDALGAAELGVQDLRDR